MDGKAPTITHGFSSASAHLWGLRRQHNSADDPGIPALGHGLVLTACRYDSIGGKGKATSVSAAPSGVGRSLTNVGWGNPRACRGGVTGPTLYRLCSCRCSALFRFVPLCSALFRFVPLWLRCSAGVCWNLSECAAVCCRLLEIAGICCVGAIPRWGRDRDREGVLTFHR